MRDAIAKVKAELGDQAVIIATRQVRRGLLGTAVEISAAVDSDDETAAPTMSGPTTGGPLPPPPRGDQDLEKLIAPLRSELRSLRALVRDLGRGPRHHRAAQRGRDELAALRRLVEGLQRPAPAARPPRPRPPRRAAAPHDAPRVRTTQQDHDAPLTAPSTGAAVMLVGPTGAGKTTTIAKLAARAALIDGRRVGLVTLDNYRVGGDRADPHVRRPDRRAARGRRDPGRARRPAGSRSDDLTLIDTAGRSPRDAAAIAELASDIAHLDARGPPGGPRRRRPRRRSTS